MPPLTKNPGYVAVYADDTNIFVISNDRSSSVTKANNVIININKLIKSNLLHTKGAGGSPTNSFRGQAELPDALYQIKNIDPSRIYRIFKIAKYIQLGSAHI